MEVLITYGAPINSILALCLVAALGLENVFLRRGVAAGEL